ILSAIFGGLARARVIELLEQNALAWSNVSTVTDLSRHPALRRIAVETPGGAFAAVRSPVRGEHIKGGAVPALGAHTDMVRREFAPEGL
ncbi:MAG: CoA transferase, partial [Proteobacteria bacterium]|nr:CoA transferase [Pseudomonadota bacterium]